MVAAIRRLFAYVTIAVAVASAAMPAAALSCGRDRTIGLYELLAADQTVSPQLIRKAAVLTADHLFESFSIILDGRIAGVSCANSVTGRVTVENARWLK